MTSSRQCWGVDEGGEGEFGLDGGGGHGAGDLVGVVGVALAEASPEVGDAVGASAGVFEAGPFDVERFGRVAQGQPLGDDLFGFGVPAGVAKAGAAARAASWSWAMARCWMSRVHEYGQVLERLAAHEVERGDELVELFVAAEGAGGCEVVEGAVEVGADGGGEADLLVACSRREAAVGRRGRRRGSVGGG
jgi:hypothetical protein